MSDVKPLDDLEMFDLIQAAYPEKFAGSTDADFDAALEFAENLQGFEEIAELLGRVALLTMPMESGLTKRLSHCLGGLSENEGRCTMTAAVRRDFKPNETPT